MTHHRFFIFSRSAMLAGLLALSASAMAAPTVQAPVATPSFVTVGQSTALTVTAYVKGDATNPVIATGVNLQRVDATGKVLATLGRMWDDGTNGDAVAGDGIFTRNVTANEPVVGYIRLQVSAAFYKLLSRVRSRVTLVPQVDSSSFAVMIGPAGGTASTDNQAVEIRVPPNALSLDTIFTVSPTTNNEVSTEQTLGQVFDFGPEGATFIQPITIQFSVLSTDLADEWSLSPYGISYWSQGAWVEVPSQANDDSRTLTADVSHFSTWASTKRATEPPTTSPDYTWSGNKCYVTMDNEYNQKLGILGQTLFGLSTPPAQGTGCVTNPYLANGYSFYIKTLENHAGIDLRAAKGSPVFAPFDGEIVWTQLDPETGKSTLTIQSTVGGNDYLLMYIHCQSHTLKRQGQTLWQLSHTDPDPTRRRVLQGDQICESGYVGTPEPHLHFEVRRVGNDAGNLLGMSGGRGICARDNLEFQGYRRISDQYSGLYDLTTRPGCPLSAIRTQNIDPVLLFVAPSTPARLNDTGITASQCYQAGSDTLVACSGAGAIALNNAQDGMTGRDVTTSSGTDGKLGFSFAAVPGGCVQDNVTGLMWEVKTTDGGLRDWTKTYTNYSATYNPSNLYGTATDASGYVASVNASGLCGYRDWRLPSADELQSIVDYGVGYPGPTIDASWFPNTPGGWFWSASPYVGDAYYAWYVYFGSGDVGGDGSGVSNYVRLVRAGQ